ncbi:protein translocase subunit SecD [Leptospirillum ferriphilum]|jgi:preprotein translocase subunit SecD|uniref:Protein translocase subunit SecD n=3 Tax=Leptospirillum ferriphilum TaxID=178606 RepID=A0A059XPE1_9BACT|nr:protein translocase subunit SecD [Leptospirillum ferriphilum]MCL5259813.1 protein translocase subunit SecD [Nitrospirota bacterium]AFS53403.1 preprotein translocase subunit SecD [Leptospirillum ferriphilum ML-04]AIA30439.1 preprotein translocase subunit SecD [Leptospirillum ferriphilum YSK]OOH70597.1 protein-export membrane protein SecD [Leptospirillum ferriphilum]OOH77515.1 protein-export membrane protein SecD [Leptospirillum ferriphilum]
MKRKIGFRFTLLGGAALLSFLLLLPSLPVWKDLPEGLRKVLPSGKISLGLDLKGGMSVTLQVDREKAVDGTLQEIATAMKTPAMQPSIQGATIHFPVPKGEQRETIKKRIARHYPYLTISSSDASGVTFSLSPAEQKRIRTHAMTQAMEVIRNRIDQFGVAEPLIERQGKDRILVELPGINDPERAMSLIGRTARLQFLLVDDKNPDADKILEKKAPVPPADEILFSHRTDANGQRIELPYLLVRGALMSGDLISDARVAFGQFNEPYVSLTFNSAGAKLFDTITREHVKERLAIVLDNVVYSAPVIQEEIAGGQAQITGNFTLKEAKDLSIVLRSGALPAPVHILQNVTVGPSLGKDSIRAGIRATIFAGILVLLFMAVYYRLSGMIADGALVLNLILLVGAMAALHATLTLPGIAGIILTIGMGVDSNVLIFERIREELRLGKPVRSAIDSGYDKAFLTIVDSHVTTLITALILFIFGTGPIKGFAVTLSVGIAINLFTALVGTRVVFDAMTARKKLDRLSI